MSALDRFCERVGLVELDGAASRGIPRSPIPPAVAKNTQVISIVPEVTEGVGSPNASEPVHVASATNPTAGAAQPQPTGAGGHDAPTQPSKPEPGGSKTAEASDAAPKTKEPAPVPTIRPDQQAWRPRRMEFCCDTTPISAPGNA